jgi:hypothetical protein
LDYAVILDDEEEMWEFLGPLSDHENLKEYAELVIRRNAGVCGRVTTGDIERAVEDRITCAEAMKHAIYPPDLQYEADNYKGSGNIPRDQSDIPPGTKPFSLERNVHEKQVRRTVNFFFPSSTTSFIYESRFRQLQDKKSRKPWRDDRIIARGNLHRNKIFSP